jgi:hypothetical protein
LWQNPLPTAASGDFGTTIKPMPPAIQKPRRFVVRPEPSAHKRVRSACHPSRIVSRGNSPLFCNCRLTKPAWFQSAESPGFTDSDGFLQQVNDPDILPSASCIKGWHCNRKFQGA